MDVRQLETFLWIARLGSIAEACKHLNVTQPTLSVRLKALEADLHVTLFSRAHNRLTLTAKGRDLVRYAEKILEMVEQVRLYVADPTAESGTIRVGIAEFVALTWAPELVQRLHRKFPNVLVDLDVGLPRPMTEGLLAGKLDVAIMPGAQRPDPPLVSVPLGAVEFSWMASPALKLNASITPKDIEKIPIIGVASRQSIFYGVVQKWFADHGVSIQRLNVCTSIAAQAALVMGGVGVSLLPNEYYAEEIRAGKLQVLRADRLFDFEFYAVCNAQSEQALPRLVAETAQSVSNFRGNGAPAQASPNAVSA